MPVVVGAVVPVVEAASTAAAFRHDKLLQSIGVDEAAVMVAAKQYPY